MLSSFAYHKFAELLFSRADKYGIQVIESNPAYSSLIGLNHQTLEVYRIGLT
jgi:transposase